MLGALHQGFVNRGMPRRDFVPKGLTDGSQAVYCLVPVQNRARPVGNGLIERAEMVDFGLAEEGGGEFTTRTQANQTVPTGRIFLWAHPGNKLPGYFRSIPMGSNYQRVKSRGCLHLLFAICYLLFA
jgi:hypothetical protein